MYLLLVENMFQIFKTIFKRAKYLNLLTALWIKGYPLRKAIFVFRKTLQKADFSSFHDQMKWEIFHYHYNENKNYRQLCPDNIVDWQQVPVTNRKILSGNFQNWIPQNSFNKKVFHSSTSGSSGFPFEFARDKFTHAIVWASIGYFYSKAKVHLDDFQARFFGVLLDKKQIRIARLKDLVANRYRFNVYDVSDQAIEKGLKYFSKKKFKYIYGYTNTLEAYAKFMLRKGIQLKSICPTLRCCIVTSEYCTEHDAAKMEEAFGVPVFNEYGSAEIGVIGFKRGVDVAWETCNNLLYIEVLNEKGEPVPVGETGLLTFTHLYNKATPLIRYQTGDIGSVCIDESDRVYICSLKGRIGDVLHLSNGKMVPTFTFYYVIKDLISKGAQINEFMIEQMEDDSFVLLYVAEQDFCENLEMQLRKIFDQYISPDYHVSTRRVDVIERGSNGKFRQFISLKTVKP